MSNTNKFQHSSQPIFRDDFGTYKFKSNDIVVNYMELPILELAESEELHTLTKIGFTAEDIMQLAQLMAYTTENYLKLANKLGVTASVGIQYSSIIGLSSGSMRPDNSNVPEVTHIDPTDNNFRMVAVVIETHSEKLPFIPVLVRCPIAYDWESDTDHFDAADEHVEEETEWSVQARYDESQPTGLVLARGLDWRNAHVIELEDWLESKEQ